MPKSDSRCSITEKKMSSEGWGDPGDLLCLFSAGYLQVQLPLQTTVIKWLCIHNLAKTPIHKDTALIIVKDIILDYSYILFRRKLDINVNKFIKNLIKFSISLKTRFSEILCETNETSVKLHYIWY